MRVLLIHQNFPAQFRHLAPALVARGDEVAAITMSRSSPLEGVTTVLATTPHRTASSHVWAKHPETVAIRAEAGFKAACALRDQGFTPDVIVAHPAWGDALLCKEVWPDAPLGIYCEFLLHRQDMAAFDTEYDTVDDALTRQAFAKIKSIPQALLLPVASAGLSPTQFQAASYPAWFRERISVLHEGIDTDRVKPDPAARIVFDNGLELSAENEVVAYIARNLEPGRGFHTFMRALPELLAVRPDAHFVIVGGDGVSYGPPPPEGTWRQVMMKEVGDRLDMRRVHFTGQLAYGLYLSLLQVARLRIYLTPPTVLSWSLLEGLAAGTPTLASDTPPVREVMTDGVEGRLFDFHNPRELAARADELLDDADRRRAFAEVGRARVVREYDLRTVCLPKQIEWVDRLAALPALPPMLED